MDPKEHLITPLGIEPNEHETRVIKIKKMETEGLKPWPEYRAITHTSLQALSAYQDNPDSTQEMNLSGRLVVKRDHGKTFFGVIQDRAGRIQIYIKKDELGDLAFEQFKKYIDIGDIIWVRGPLFITKMGETTVNVLEVTLLSKCLHPLPEKFHGLTDVEQRYRQRYLDLISNPESKEKFKKRSLIVRTIRQFLQEKDFLEVETPMLHPIPGGAAARPFITHHNAYDMDLFLRIAPELYLKQLVVGGFERVFEINRNFRNEGVSTRHNPEFTMLEFYMAHGDYLDGIALTEELLATAVRKNFDSLQVQFHGKTIDFTPPLTRLTVEESLVQLGNLTPDQISKENIDALIKKHKIQVHSNAGYGVKLFALFEEFVEPNIVQPTFIIGYPIEVSPLSKRDPNNPELAARFELFVCGMELANGFTELNDPFDQAERFKGQAQAREGGDDEAHYYDADYIKALEYGLPPTVGVGIGIDRLVMMLTDTSTIKDVILFPTLKQATPANAPQKKKHPATNQDGKPERFITHPELFEDFKNLRIAIIVITDADNTGSTNELIPQMHALSEKIRHDYTSQTVTDAPAIAVWRQAYRTFGSKPSEFPCSIESLYKRILKGQTLNSVNPLVNIYNYISLKYMLPAGGEDLDHMKGDLQLTYATADEQPVVVLGKDSSEAPYAGEVIYKDGIGTICRRWNWREVKRTVLTSNTKNAILVLEALDSVSDETLVNAQQELVELIKKYCKANVETVIINEEHNCYEFPSKTLAE